MKLLFCVLVVALALTVSATASYFDFEQITVATASIGFTVSKITPTGLPAMTYADCRLRTAQINVLWVDPAVTTVSSTVGQLLEIGDRIILVKREEILNFRAIRTGSTSGQLDCIYKDLP